MLEVDRDLAVVQVLEGTERLGTSTTPGGVLRRPLQHPRRPGLAGPRLQRPRRAARRRTADPRGHHRAGRPATRSTPRTATDPPEPILTGVSVIDAFTTLVRGQKLPIFSIAGLPHLELAAQIAAQATRGGGAVQRRRSPGMGLTHADAAMVRSMLEQRSGAGELLLLLNTADDPVIERILTPRIALTVAEHLAFELGRHVLVVMADMTSYAEALREVSAARGEMPGRRAYPGYLYSDLASLYERCGRVRGRPGSVTVLPVLTMPAGDITHPVPDLTGYITEGQIVLDAGLHARDVYPPVDPLSSLSRLMRHGAGPGRTREDHLDLAAQLLAGLARAREVRELVELVGAGALSATDRSYLDLATSPRARPDGPARR